MRYSFIIPTFENSDLLMNSLEALNHLNYSPNQFELIVIDDGSKHSCVKKIESNTYRFKWEYYYLERTAESSRCRARNYGTKKASGEYIIFIDADIIVKPDYLLEMDRVFLHANDCVAIGTRLMLREKLSYHDVKDGSIFERYSYINATHNMLDFRIPIFQDLSFNLNSYKYPFIYALTCNFAVPRRCLHLVNGFDEELIYWGIEDIELAYRLYKQEICFVLNNKLEVLHQMHGNHGEFVEEDKIQGLNYNVNLFLKKHPEALPLLSEDVYELFQSIATRYKWLEPAFEKNTLTLKIDFTMKSQLNSIKSLITVISELNEYQLVIKDYLEETDLDIWIQLLSNSSSKIKYYPQSRTDYLVSEGSYEKV